MKINRKVPLSLFAIVLILVAFWIAAPFRGNPTNFLGEERQFAEYAWNGAKAVDSDFLDFDYYKVTEVRIVSGQPCNGHRQWSNTYEATVYEYTWYGKPITKFIMNCEGGAETILLDREE